MEKKCTRCLITKPFDQFSTTARSKDGHYSRCKECRSRDRVESIAKNNPNYKPLVKKYEVAKEGYKICRWCREEKPLEEFGKAWYRKDGRLGHCKKCNRTAGKTYYDKNRASSVEKKRQYDRTFDGKYSQWKQNAKNRNIEWLITKEDLLKMPMICYYTKRDLTFEHHQFNTVSLDRKDNTKGYTIDNVVYCCSTVNLMKNTLTFKEFIDTCRVIAAQDFS